MKAIDMKKNSLLLCGLQWIHSKAPSSKEMIGKLEKNEAYISWVQPNGGTIEDQIPCIRMGNGFYTLSLRMLKSIFRHVRLKKGFVNRQDLPHIGTILRIPNVLLLEKLKTQQRFNVSMLCRAHLACIPLKSIVSFTGNALQGIGKQNRHR